MSLIFRLLWLLISSPLKPRLPYIKPVNELKMRVWPNDLDINMHMNNGRYQTICDLTRVDMFIRTGLAKTMWQEKWTPIIAEHTMVYKKALRLLQPYVVKMEVTGWDDRSFDMVHTFIKGDRVVATGTSKGIIYSKEEGIIHPEKVLQTVEKYLATRKA